MENFFKSLNFTWREEEGAWKEGGDDAWLQNDWDEQVRAWNEEQPEDDENEGKRETTENVDFAFAVDLAFALCLL